MDTTNGTLDEALQRLHRSGPEFQGYLSNHGPMAVEALVRNGHAPTVHRWLDAYETRLEDLPPARTPIGDDDWREALGDTARVTDWTGYFSRRIAERPWREVLTEWWPRLLPGIAGAATHPVIRVGHAVRALLRDGEDATRLSELACALGYWAARHTLLPVTVTPSGRATPPPTRSPPSPASPSGTCCPSAATTSCPPPPAGSGPPSRCTFPRTRTPSGTGSPTWSAPPP
ncbi:questin oxidase family protein [Streptomyces triculaminicus]|uniref:questin oxidase family protein n=1 Tax=Streptomyces triculaminicus TaxID=2816232 RepID=UPI003555CA45